MMRRASLNQLLAVLGWYGAVVIGEGRALGFRPGSVDFEARQRTREFLRAISVVHEVLVDEVRKIAAVYFESMIACEYQDFGVVDHLR